MGHRAGRLQRGWCRLGLLPPRARPQPCLPLGLGLWNGKDPILKERLFGLTNGEGNHGEDVKELYYYLDATPTHSYLKFKDPDDNHLEILQFPKGKGDPRWHKPTERLFLGIDHTAIVVRDTEEALRFYRDGLGMTVRGHSENYGIEQEHLNNVFGARLKITSVGASTGPAIEFLEYLSPKTGRPIPGDTRANDLWHWQIRMQVDSLDALPNRIAVQGGSLVPPGVITMSTGAQFQNALHARGPTGHAVLIHDALPAGDNKND